MSKSYFTYLLASRWHALCWCTNDLAKRLGEHRDGSASAFTRRYGVKLLVWYEVHEDINVAIAREKQIKGWNRAWKIRLIEERNSGWNDLAEKL